MECISTLWETSSVRNTLCVCFASSFVDFFLPVFQKERKNGGGCMSEEVERIWEEM